MLLPLSSNNNNSYYYNKEIVVSCISLMVGKFPNLHKCILITDISICET